MIVLWIGCLIASVVVFFILRRLPLLIRLFIAIVFWVGSSVFVYLKVAESVDAPPPNSRIYTQEELERDAGLRE